MLTFEETLSRARDMLDYYRIDYPDTLSVESFQRFAAITADCIRYVLPRVERDKYEMRELLEGLKSLYDNYERLRQGDPMALYKPAHKVAETFERSRAKIRLWFGGNRTSKTQSGYTEDYRVGTRNHPFWALPPGATAVGIIGLAFSQYAPNVFEKKMITGEPSNPLSPMFPEGGRWLYGYNERKRIITLACPDCAKAWKAKTCSHPKSTITLYSDEGGWEVLAGAQFNLVHLDEHVREGFFAEAIQRTQAIQGRMIVTLTPAFGPEAWEERRLHKLVKGNPAENRLDPQDPNSPPYVDVFTISQYDAGITPLHEIEASKRTMDDFEIECRIYGRTMPDARNAVFDRRILSAMKAACITPKVGSLSINLAKGVNGAAKLPEGFSGTSDIELLMLADELVWSLEDVPELKEWTGLRVWKEPEAKASYLLSVDAAAGLSPKTRDPSCATVLKATSSKDGMPMFEIVAQYHGWINPFQLADEVKKLGIWYNFATVAIETTGGYGAATMMRLREQLFYPNIWRDLTQPDLAMVDVSARVGIDTNVSTKPLMVAALQQTIAQGRISIPCEETIYELSYFQQETTTASGQKLAVPRYRGAEGAHDDRVMSLVIGVFAGLRTPVVDFYA